jgi:hypothetical protein
MTLSFIGFFITFGVYMSRLPHFNVTVFVYACLFSLPFFPAIGMLIYHTQLSVVNLTTNEHQNLHKYDYLFAENGQYRNPFFRSLLKNFLDRMAPTEALYILPVKDQERQSLIDGVV